MRKIKVGESEINVVTVNAEDYISLTDMVRGVENGLALIEKWLRNKNTIEFLGIWEEMYNPDFNSPEFGGILSAAGTNRHPSDEGTVRSRRKEPAAVNFNLQSQ